MTLESVAFGVQERMRVHATFGDEATRLSLSDLEGFLSGLHTLFAVGVYASTGRGLIPDRVTGTFGDLNFTQEQVGIWIRVERVTLNSPLDIVFSLPMVIGGGMAGLGTAVTWAIKTRSLWDEMRLKHEVSKAKLLMASMIIADLEAASAKVGGKLPYELSGREVGGELPYELRGRSRESERERPVDKTMARAIDVLDRLKKLEVSTPEDRPPSLTDKARTILGPGHPLNPPPSA